MQFDWLFWSKLLNVVVRLLITAAAVFNLVGWLRDPNKWQHKFRGIAAGLTAIAAIGAWIVWPIDIHLIREKDGKVNQLTATSESLVKENKQLNTRVDDLAEENKELTGKVLKSEEEAKKSQAITQSLEQKNLQEEKSRKQFEELKKTIPQLKPSLEVIEPGKYEVVIESATLVPVKLDWRVVNLSQKPFPGMIMGELPTFHPKAEERIFRRVVSIDPAQIPENYLELRVTYHSVYAEEMKLHGLSGHWAIPYRLSDDGKSLTLLEKIRTPKGVNSPKAS